MDDTRGTDAARIAALCEAHRDLPRRVAEHVAARLPAHADDLEPAAWEGLWRAAVSWRPDGGKRFRSWAWQRAHAHILDDLRALDPLPRRRRAAHRLARDTRDRLHNSLHRAPTDTELAHALGITLDAWRALQVEMTGPALPALAVERTPWVIDRPARGDPDLTAFVRAAVDALPDRHRLVVYSRVWDRVPTRAVAAHLGVTESRVSQIWGDAAGMIRDAHAWYMHGQPGPELSGRAASRRAAYRSRIVDRLEHQ